MYITILYRIIPIQMEKIMRTHTYFSYSKKKHDYNYNAKKIKYHSEKYKLNNIIENNVATRTKILFL